MLLPNFILHNIFGLTCVPLYTHSVMETMTFAELELLTHEELEGDLCSEAFADTVALSDNLKTDVAIPLADTVTLADIVNIPSALVTLSDILTIVDALEVSADISLADTVTLADIVNIPSTLVTLSDILTIAELLSGTLAPGYITPGTADFAYETVGPSPAQPKTWRKIVTNEPSPISALTQSSAGTTFTITSVADSAAWDLTQVAVSDIAITGDKYLAVITGIGANSITVDAWTKAGHGRRRGATDKPADGETVTIHRMVRAKQVLIRADASNTNIVYQGFSEWTNMNTGHPIPPASDQVNASLPIKAPRDRWLNTSRIWVISGTTQNVTITIGAINNIKGH